MISKILINDRSINQALKLEPYFTSANAGKRIFFIRLFPSSLSKPKKKKCVHWSPFLAMRTLLLIQLKSLLHLLDGVAGGVPFRLLTQMAHGAVQQLRHYALGHLKHTSNHEIF